LITNAACVSTIMIISRKGMKVGRWWQ